MARSTFAVACLILLGLHHTIFAQTHQNIEFTRLDDFEDDAAWLKGDPKTDLEQHDSAVTTSTDLVKEGKRSLVFMNKINWTPRPNEKYPKGWPMIWRKFQPPQDWSTYDYIYFWLYPRTNSRLLQENVLKVGFLPAGSKGVEKWYNIPDIVPNQWQEIAVPLTLEIDWRQIAGIYFYIAEAWYQDGDRIDFYFDDMRLARRTVPAFAYCMVSARIFPRGQAVGLKMKVLGPYEGTTIRCKITDTAGNEQGAFTEKIAAKEQDFTFAIKGIPAGAHYALAELLNAQGQVLDSQKKYFRSLQPGKRSYLKLITFYTRPLKECDARTLSVLNDSAYAGVAIPLIGNYVSDPVPGYESYQHQMKMVREALKIDPWPWVALNRMIGAPSDRTGHAASHATRLDYFLKIKAMDLDNEAGAREDMLRLWRYAVRMAKEWRSPGIMLDPEAYNDYRAYDVSFVAERRGQSVHDVIARCEALGAEFAKIIAEEYPQCVVWSLFSRLEVSRSLPGRKEKTFTTPTHILLGMLRYAKQNNVPLKLLCGGETMPGYCNKSLDDLKQKIMKRDDALAPFLEEFGERLDLAGTISPLHDYAICNSWIQKGYADTPFKSLTDFAPLFTALFDAYDYNWIYASSAARTEPYKPENNRMYNDVLRAALDASAANGLR